MVLKFTHDLSPLHMPHYYLASLPAGTCWQTIWASFIPCFSEHVLPDGGCQQSPDPAVALPSVVAFAYPCILTEIWFLSSSPWVSQALCSTESRHHSEEQECIELGLHKPRVAHRPEFGNSFIVPFDCKKGIIPLHIWKLNLESLW